MKKNVGIFILNEEYERNYISSGVFEGLDSQFNVEIFRDTETLEKIPKAGTPGSYFDFKANSRKRIPLLFSVIMWKHRDLSKSFRYREIRAYSLRFQLQNLNENAINRLVNSNASEKPYSRSTSLLKAFKAVTILIRKALNLIFERVFVRCAAHPIAYPFFIRSSKILEINSSKLEKFVDAQKLDLIVIPTSAYDATAHELVLIGKKLAIPTLFLVDNWDNLSSKTLLIEKPTYIATWGPQSSGHAIKIQQMPKDRVFDLGSARYVVYERSIKQTNSNYAIFAGSFLKFDEIGALQALESEIEGDPDFYGDFKIIYRPHPERLNLSVFNSLRFENIILDPQISALGEEKINQSNLSKLDLNYYATILNGARFVVGGLTSFLIEAGMCGKNFLALVHDERGSITSPKRVLESYEHFAGIEQMRHLVLNYEFTNFRNAFRKMYIDSNQRADSSGLEHFITFDGAGYKSRLQKLLQSITANNHV